MEGSTSTPPNESPSLDKVTSDLEQAKIESDNDSCHSCSETESNASLLAEFFSSKRIDGLHEPEDQPYTRIECKESPEYKILEQLVQDDGVLVSAVLQQLFDLTKKAIQQVDNEIRTEGHPEKVHDTEGNYIGSSLDLHVRMTYYAWIDLVHINPVSKHAKLGEFITRLQRNKMVYTKSGRHVRLDSSPYPPIGWKNELWGDLPLFDRVVAEEDDFFDVLHPLHTPKQKECRENFVIMIARMTQRCPRDDDFFRPMNFFYAARHQFNDAFLVLRVEQPDDDYRVKTTELAVRQACIWMIYAADALRHGTKLQQAKEKSETTPGRDWDRWRSGFQALIKAHDEGREDVYFHDAPLDGRTGRMVYAALREMERVSGKEEG